jgi:hypothetical protein
MSTNFGNFTANAAFVAVEKFSARTPQGDFSSTKVTVSSLPTQAPPTGRLTTDFVDIKKPPRSPEEMKAAAKQAFTSEANSLAVNSKILEKTSTKKLNETQATWNKNIAEKLPVKASIDEKGLLTTTPEQIAKVQLQSLTNPDSIDKDIWNSIPNKHFESKNEYSDYDKRHLVDWKDGNISRSPERARNEKFGFYQSIKDNFKDLKDLNQKDALKKIISLEKNGWNKTFSESELFDGLDPNQQEAAPVEVNITEIPGGEKLKKELIATKDKILENQKQGAKAHEQTWNLGEVLRNSKTAKDIMADPLYIQKKFLKPSLEDLRKAAQSSQPELAVPMVMNSIKADLRNLIGDMANMQESTTASFKKYIENNPSIKPEEKKAADKIINKIVDNIVSNLETSSGREIIEHYGSDVGNAKSPFENIKGEQANAYGQLQGIVKSAAQGNGKLTFESLAEVAKELQLPKSSLGDSKLSENINVNDNVTLAKNDPVFCLLKCSTDAFEEALSGKKDLMNVQLGLVPFETDPEKQKQLEVILNSERFSKLSLAGEYKVGDKKTVFSPALLSRIKHLYYLNSQRQKTETPNVPNNLV